MMVGGNTKSGANRSTAGIPITMAITRAIVVRTLTGDEA
jgi:hypothetical protein